MNYILHLTVMLEIYILLAMSANQIVGLSGLLSLGQAVFYGLGAYATAIAITKLNLSFWTAIPIFILTNTVAAVISSYISAKVRGLYFGLGTLALQVIFFSLVYNGTSLTNGPYGISGISSPSFLGYVISTPASFALFGALWLVIVLAFYLWFLKTPISRLVQAARDDEIALLNFGSDPKYYKTISITVSSLIAGLAGSLYATYATFIDPSSFTLDESMIILSIVLIGGAGTLSGAIIGAVIYVLLPEFLKILQISDAFAANIRMILFGMILVLIVRFRPEGVIGKKLIR